MVCATRSGGSITITLVPESGPVLLAEGMELPLSPAIRVQNLVREMKDSGKFSPELLAKIDEWEQTFGVFFNSLSIPEERTTAAQALCFLLFEVIRPGLLDPRAEIFAEAFFGFESTLTDLVRDLLPQGVSPQRFVILYEQFFNEEKRVRKKLDCIQRMFAEQMSLIYAQGQEIAQQIQRLFASTRARLLEIESSRSSLSGEIKGRIQSLRRIIENAEAGILEKERALQGLNAREQAAKEVICQLVQDIRNTVQKE